MIDTCTQRAREREIEGEPDGERLSMQNVHGVAVQSSFPFCDDVYVVTVSARTAIDMTEWRMADTHSQKPREDDIATLIGGGQRHVSTVRGSATPRHATPRHATPRSLHRASAGDSSSSSSDTARAQGVGWGGVGTKETHHISAGFPSAFVDCIVKEH